MSILQELIRRIRALPLAERRQLRRRLHELERLDRKCSSVARRPGRALLGALSHAGAKSTRRDIDEARSELWGRFPREIAE